MTRAEVLLRWNHPQRGLIPPSVFVPIAERTGLIRTVTDWLLERALAQVHAWREAGAPIHIAVNISAKSLLDQALPAKIHSMLTKWDVDPRFLKIEITESSIMADPAHALAVMSMLQSMGVRLSVDDFGTGYSSLTHLRQLPIDEIKIDKSFVMNMSGDENDAAIVRSTIDLGRNLGLEVVAEGVETQEVWDRLSDLGCDVAQGYYLSRPQPPDQLTAWMADSKAAALLARRSAVA
jgi:EAL domain-containing protein (putative c-di-GMP-specific phosphodiesterase class I)